MMDGWMDGWMDGDGGRSAAAGAARGLYLFSPPAIQTPNEPPAKRKKIDHARQLERVMIFDPEIQSFEN